VTQTRIATLLVAVTPTRAAMVLAAVTLLALPLRTPAADST